MIRFLNAAIFSAVRCITLLVAVIWLSFAIPGPLSAEEQVVASGNEDAFKPLSDAIPRSDFFPLERLDDSTKQLSEDLLFRALDSEAFYTLVGQLKPVSEGFWSGYFSIDAVDLAEIENVSAALRPWNSPNLFFADVLVYESIQHGQRYASAYVIHVPSLRKLIEEEADFFARWGITINTPPGEIMMAIERSRQPDERWRGFGLVFGYPEYAVDFFVAAGMHQRATGEFVERDFRQIPTFGSRTGNFVYAVPKLSRPRPEDIELQRQAAVLLSEYKRLRPQYLVAPDRKPVELLRDWMDNGTGNCHPDHLVAKLPVRTEAEIDAEIAEWSASEKQTPEVSLNHISLVLNRDDFDAIRSSDFVRNQLAASDQGFPKFLPVDEQSQSIYLRGSETYLELLGPENKFHEPVGKVGVGWCVEEVGELDVVQKLLSKEAPELFTRVLNQWDFDREGVVNWYYSLFREQRSSASIIWWFSETHADFIPALYPNAASDGDRPAIARRDFLGSRYDATRILRNVTSFTTNLPPETARLLRYDLEHLGWRCDEFDSRTWILRGPDFRFMVVVQPEGTTATIESIGFETNPGVEQQAPHPIGNNIEVTFDGKQSGWILFKR